MGPPWGRWEHDPHTTCSPSGQVFSPSHGTWGLAQGTLPLGPWEPWEPLAQGNVPLGAMGTIAPRPMAPPLLGGEYTLERLAGGGDSPLPVP